jgi:uncharacterized membrane protein YeaQ/YmgE (transglycosylase-associated protein family)
MDISEIIGAIVLGIVAGFLARALLPGKQSMGLIMTMLLGIAGAFVGYLIFTELLGIGDEDKFDLGGLVGAVIGAMILLFIYERTIGARPATAAAPVTSTDREARRGDRQRRR